MTEEERDIDLIEGYHRGTLGDGELENFLTRKATDREFAEKVKTYSELIQGIEYYGERKDFAETIASWDKEIKEGRKNFGIGHFKISRSHLAIAATVLLLAIPLGTWWINMNSVDPRLAPYEDITRMRSGSASPPTPFSSGMDAYNRKDYPESVRLLQSAVRKDRNDFLATFYLAESYLALNQPDSARIYYRNSLALESNPLSELSEWRLALSYLKQENLPSLKRNLESILDIPGHSYHTEAEELYGEYWQGR